MSIATHFGIHVLTFEPCCLEAVGMTPLAVSPTGVDPLIMKLADLIGDDNDDNVLTLPAVHQRVQNLL